jgi:hypothetical protein
LKRTGRRCLRANMNEIQVGDSHPPTPTSTFKKSVSLGNYRKRFQTELQSNDSGLKCLSWSWDFPYRSCLDAHVFISTHMCWSGSHGP